MESGAEAIDDSGAKLPDHGRQAGAAFVQGLSGMQSIARQGGDAFGRAAVAAINAGIKIPSVTVAQPPLGRATGNPGISMPYAGTVRSGAEDRR